MGRYNIFFLKTIHISPFIMEKKKINEKWSWVSSHRDTNYLLKNLISNRKGAIYNKIFNSNFERVHLKYKTFWRFTSVSYNVVMIRYFALVGVLECKIYDRIYFFQLVYYAVCWYIKLKNCWDRISCFSITKFIQSINYWFVKACVCYFLKT